MPDTRSQAGSNGEVVTVPPDSYLPIWLGNGFWDELPLGPHR